jgi:hypothetical protein
MKFPILCVLLATLCGGCANISQPTQNNDALATHPDPGVVTATSLLEAAANTATITPSSHAIHDQRLITLGIEPGSHKAAVLDAWTEKIETDPVITANVQGGPQVMGQMLLDPAARDTLVKNGWAHLSPEERLAFFKLLTQLVDKMMPSDCYGLGDSRAVMTKAASIKTMSDAEIDAYFELMYDMLRVSALNTPITMPTPVQHAAAVAKFGLAVEAELKGNKADLDRLVAFAVNGAKTSRTNACWGTGVSLHAVISMNDPDRDVMLVSFMQAVKQTPSSAKAAASLYAQENFLFDQHQHYLAEQQMQADSAKSDQEKASFLAGQASALNSLNRNDEALNLIKQALQLSKPDRNFHIVAIEANILFSMDKPQAALDVLLPQLAHARLAEQKNPGILSVYGEHFITATFSYIRLEQWQNAIDTLVDAQSPLEGPSFYAYRGLLYRYIVKRANDPTLDNATLEKNAEYYMQHDPGHYGMLLKLWAGDDVHLDIDQMIKAISNADDQEAASEVLFYSAAFDKFVKNDSNGARAKLEKLNKLAPYGSAEWIYGKWVL